MPRDDSAPPADGKAIIISPSAPMTVAGTFLNHVYGDERYPRLVRHRGVFYQWNGTAWSEIGEEPIRAKIYDFLAKCFRSGEKGLDPIHPNIKLVNEVLAALKAVALIGDEVEPPVWLGGDERPSPNEIVVFQNGLLHLPTLDLIPPTPDFFTLSALGVEWDPNAPEPKRFLAFLKQLWPDDQESINTLQKIFGYLLTRGTKLQKAFMLVGPPRSGKGTIGRVLTALVGKQNVTSPTLSTLSGRFGRASLIDKLIAIIGDARVGRDTDPVAIAEHILSITGEDAVTIERKNKDDWIGRLSVRFVVLCTEVPQMADDSAGIADRFIILQLVKSFLGQEDLDLTDGLLRELGSIAVWSVAGWHALFGDKGSGTIAQPESAQGHVDDIKDLASSIKHYLDERCEFGPDYHVEKAVLYKDHCSWREAQGLKAIAQAVFGRKLRTAFPGLAYYHPDSEQGRGRPKHYLGLRLRR
jgi:putative DNA primase/helicase